MAISGLGALPPPPYDEVCIDPIFDLSEHAQRAVADYEARREEAIKRLLPEPAEPEPFEDDETPWP